MTTITKRLLILQGVLLLGLGSLYILPKRHGAQPVGIQLSLPVEVGEWHGEDRDITAQEKQVLGPGTEFARKLYTAPEGALFVSIVLSGHDVNTSLHRPERCLPAQGWSPLEHSTETIPLSNGQSIQTTRLFNQSTVGDSSQPGGYSVYYYWFVGCSDVVASPLQRSMIDWRDRLFGGYDQRWAYVTVAASLRDDAPKTREAADNAVKNFVAALFPKIWKPAIPKG